MRRRDEGMAPEWESFFQRRRVQRALPPELRARVMARAREIAAARGARPVTPVGMAVATRVTNTPSRPRFAWRIAFAVALAVALGTIGAVAALRARRPVVVTAQGVALRRAHQASMPDAPMPDSRSTSSAASVPSEAPPPAGEPVVGRLREPSPARHAHAVAHASRHGQPGLHAADPFEAELRVLHPAHEAFERGDWNGALRLVLEHARSFPSSHFAEEREALRVDCLAHLGRKAEAHRAGLAFASRFPHSALLARVRAAAE